MWIRPKSKGLSPAKPPNRKGHRESQLSVIDEEPTEERIGLNGDHNAEDEGEHRENNEVFEDCEEEGALSRHQPQRAAKVPVIKI